MKTPETSCNFTRWRDPASGVESLILTGRVAACQQSFYFVNDGFSADGRYLWFYCANPPSKAYCLGLLDFECDRMHFFPETQFLDASPAVKPETGEVWFFSRTELWKLAPHPEARPQYVNRLPDEIVRGRNPVRVATHITFSPRGGYHLHRCRIRSRLLPGGDAARRRGVQHLGTDSVLCEPCAVFPG